MRLLLVVAVCLTTACGPPEPVKNSVAPPASPALPIAPSVPSRDPWRDAQERGIDFRAVGQEPGWFVEIDEGKSLRLLYDYGDGEVVAPVGAAAIENGRTTYRTTSSRSRVIVTVEDRPCSDAMSGQPFPSTVTVTVGDRALHGCGRRPGEASTWQASARQVGPVRVGMTIAEAEAAIGAPFTAADPAECTFRRTPGSPAGMLFMQMDGRIARIDVTSFDVRTDTAAGVGDSERQVQEAYGRGLETTPHKYTTGHYLTVRAGDHRIVFETDGQWVTRYRVGRLPEVEWVEGCS